MPKCIHSTQSTSKYPNKHQLWHKYSTPTNTPFHLSMHTLFHISDPTDPIIKLNSLEHSRSCKDSTPWPINLSVYSTFMDSFHRLAYIAIDYGITLSAPCSACTPSLIPLGYLLP